VRERNPLVSRLGGAILSLILIFGVAGRPAKALAAGDGFVWSALGTGMGGSQVQVAPGVVLTAEVKALAVAPDGTVYAGGSFETVGGVSASNIAKWNGATWSPLGPGIRGIVEALAVAPDGTLYAAASGWDPIGIVKWN